MERFNNLEAYLKGLRGFASGSILTVAFIYYQVQNLDIITTDHHILMSFIQLLLPVASLSAILLGVGTFIPYNPVATGKQTTEGHLAFLNKVSAVLFTSLVCPIVFLFLIKLTLILIH